ncbi:MAG: Uncharacterised protein [Flavobacterium sp. SCGC AAA160-P02]|nr:MAG: Uncharacterised protein [Flavobacterium sp. SCGC AAA160-P02]
MKKITYFIIIFCFIITSNAQSKKKKDQNAIKGMCGCFEVTFNFAETFNYSEDPDYKPSKTKISKGLEWAQLVADEKDKISIQHLLVIGKAPNQFIVKHWKQDWLYENTDFYMYNGNNVWEYEKKPISDVKKQWTQKVFQVDDSPRYEGSGSWVHIDGKSYWENRTDAPLPRREYTKRSDYNITQRGNRHEITDFGWAHDQNNKKIIREEKKDDIIIAEEKGYNTYVRVDDEKCKAAQVWWQKNYDKWSIVRSEWAEVYNRNKTLKLKNKVDNKVLYKYLFSDDFTTKDKIHNIIHSFIKK